MIAPEQWYEHQKNYQRYGFDMKPETERQPRKRERTIKKISMPAGDAKKLAFVTVIAVAVAFITVIILTAYSASIRYDINSMIRKNNTLMGEIENLQVQVYSANNVDYIETKATGDMKMVYPESGDRIYIASGETQQQGFADIIREKAYN